jgi:hypothetical protein
MEDENWIPSMEVPIIAASNPKGKGTTLVPSSPDVSDANSRSYHSFHSREERGRKMNVTEGDGYGKKERMQVGGKRKNLEASGLIKAQDSKASCLNERFVKPFSFKAQLDRSKPSLVYRPKLEGHQVGGIRGKQNKLSPRGEITSLPQASCSVLEAPRTGECTKSPKHGSGHTSETTPMDHNKKFLDGSKSGGKVKVWKRLAWGRIWNGEKECTLSL